MNECFNALRCDCMEFFANYNFIGYIQFHLTETLLFKSYFMVTFRMKNPFSLPLTQNLVVENFVPYFLPLILFFFFFSHFYLYSILTVYFLLFFDISLLHMLLKF